MLPPGPRGSAPSRRLPAALLGLGCALLLLEAALRLGGWASAWLQQGRDVQAARSRGAYRVLCLGECTTWQQYPRLLEAALNKNGSRLSFAVTDAGIAGANSSDVLDRARTEFERSPPDMVVAMMGINDFGAVGGCEDIPEAGGFWFRHLRTYRLARILSMQAANKLGSRNAPPERGSDPGIFHQSQGQPPPRPPRPAAPDDLVLLPPGPDADRIQEALAAMGQHDQARAERLLRQALAANPANDVACNELGVIYMAQRKLPQAMKAFQQAVRLGARHLSGSGDASSALGRIYQEEGRWEQAEAMFRNAIELKPHNDKARFELAEFYREQGRLSEARRYYQETLELDPGNDGACAALSLLYARLGDVAQARLYERKTAELRSRVNPMTARNYRRLKERLDAKGIRLVCVQYPMMSVSPLRRIFAGDADEPLFVDNEAVFREAVRRGSSAEYFRDLFGGDFGHCTRKGNQLLADNIAQAILRRYFRR